MVSNLYPEDRDNLRQAFEVLGSEFESYGYGRWISDFPKGDSWPAGAINTSHFMGGTRMSAKAEDGVVDEDCRVHGMSNLSIAGGSVFPTAGVSMVTYTAVLLALRAADRIAGNALDSSSSSQNAAPRPDFPVSPRPEDAVGASITSR